MSVFEITRVDYNCIFHYFQKHPGKSKGGPSSMQAMYAMQNMRNSKMGMMGPGGPVGFGPNSSNTVAQWVQQQNQNLQEQGLGMNEDPRMMFGPQNPNFSQMMMESGMFDPDMNMPGGLSNMNLMQSKVPNENLTPEQLQRREEQLANLRKIQQMLFPEQRQQQEFPPGSGGPGGGPGGPGMMPGEMNMGMYPQNMMASKRAMMMAQQNMMSSPHGMMDSRQEMMSQEQFMMSQGMPQYGPGPHPQNMQNMSQAQREWMRLQQEYIVEKRQMHQRSMSANGPGPQMGPGMDPARGGQGQPPPSYYSSIAQKQRHGSVGMASPTSPNMNGPLGSPSMVAQGPDPSDPLMFPTGPQRKSSFSGMDPMGPVGPVGGLGMGGMDPMMQHPQGSPMNPNMMGPMGGLPHNVKNSAQVTLQRAGNPEQFHPDMASSGPICSSASKPPPSYAQSQSTKRKREDMEELCKNLQPTPSPQHISYLNQFEGQELTITKQVNTAYRETNSSESQSNHFSQNQVVNSPMHGPNSNKGPMSNSSQTSSGPLGSPVPVTGNPGQGPSPMSGANMRLSHYDPQQQQPPQNQSISNSPSTPSGKSSLSNNITSATLANLAKGVENLSNQMQQHMMQGGPFHSIQMQGQQQQQNQQNSQGPPSHSGVVSSAVQSQNQQSTNSLMSTSQTQSTPSVNNTFVNATMSIQQVNIQQNVPPGQNSFNPGGGGSTMQVQQTNMEQTQMSMSQSGSMNQTASMNQTGNNMTQSASMNQSSSMTQSVSMAQTNSNKNTAAMAQTSKITNSNMGSPASAAQHGAMGNMGPNKMSPFAQSQNPNSGMGMNPQVAGSGRPGSPNFPAGSVGNANVQIQQKAPNTIQYLPANQSGMPPEPKNMKPDLAFMQQFDSPLINIEGKVPTSKMQYFPSGQPYGPGGMGPGQDLRMGPGQDPRMGPGQDARMGTGQDPRMLTGQDPRMGPGQDPRMGPGHDLRMGSGQDPRLGPGQDPRMGPGQDPRMGPGQDPRMGPSMGQGPDPRMVGQNMGAGMDPRGDPRMGPMVDPRMGPGPDPRMGQRSDPRMGPGMPDMVMSPESRLGGSMGSISDPRIGPSLGSSMGPGGPMMHGGSMRPGSRGSPFTGPIGPAVQQSMMMRRGSLTDIPSISMGGMGSPDPMASMAGMSSSIRENPMSALSSMSGNPMNSAGSNPMTAMSNMSNSIMSDQLGPGGPGTGMGSMGNMPYNSPPYQGGGQSVMNNPMMSGPGGPMSMHGVGPRLQGPVSSMGGMSRQGMRMPGPSMGPGPLSPGAQYQQFQQQLYSQGRSRQMSPMEGMMGNPGPGYMGPGPGMNPGMMPGMHGPM